MGGNLHTAAACLKAGDRVLIDDWIARITPLRAIARTGLAGGESVGLGKWEMPCWRMHSETSSIWALACAWPGSSLSHVSRADLNEREYGLIAELESRGAPCARMHRLKARTASWCDRALGLLEGPYAEIASAETITTSAIAARWLWRLMLFMFSFLSFAWSCARRFYRGAYNRSATETVTPLFENYGQPLEREIVLLVLLLPAR